MLFLSKSYSDGCIYLPFSPVFSIICYEMYARKSTVGAIIFYQRSTGMGHFVVIASLNVMKTMQDFNLGTKK